MLRRQAQPNNFSLGWKNIFFLRRMWKKHLSDGAPTGRKRCEEVRKSPSFSLFGGRKLSKSGWHNERWILFGAYVLLACLRVVCLILVQEVSKSCGGGDTKGFCKCVRIVFLQTNPTLGVYGRRRKERNVKLSGYGILTEKRYLCRDKDQRLRIWG